MMPLQYSEKVPGQLSDEARRQSRHPLRRKVSVLAVPPAFFCPTMWSMYLESPTLALRKY